eukprot:4958580-Amphidinium_carterae.1
MHTSSSRKYFEPYVEYFQNSSSNKVLNPYSHHRLAHMYLTCEDSSTTSSTMSTSQCLRLSFDQSLRHQWGSGNLLAAQVELVMDFIAILVQLST